MDLPVVAYLDFASNALPLGAGIYRWKVLARGARWFLGFLGLGVLTEAISFTLARSGIPTLSLLQVYHLVGYLLLLFTLRFWIAQRTVVLAVKVCMVCYLLAWVVTKLTVEPIEGLDWYTFPAIGVVITGLALTVVFSHVADGTGDFLSDAVFWFASGIFLYFIANLVFFSLLAEYIKLDRETGVAVWSIHWAVNVLVNTVYAWGFWISGRHG